MLQPQILTEASEALTQAQARYRQALATKGAADVTLASVAEANGAGKKLLAARQAVATAEADAAIALADVNAAQSSILTLTCTALVLLLQAPTGRRQAAAAPPVQPALTWPAGTLITVTENSGARRDGMILELLDEGLYLVRFDGAPNEKVHPSQVAELRRATPPAAPTATAIHGDPAARISKKQAGEVLALLQAHFPDEKDRRTWLWETARVAEPSIGITTTQAEYAALVDALEKKVGKAATKAARAAMPQPPAPAALPDDFDEEPAPREQAA